jgi:hypothetical protein
LALLAIDEHIQTAGACNNTQATTWNSKAGGHLDVTSVTMFSVVGVMHSVELMAWQSQKAISAFAFAPRKPTNTVPSFSANSNQFWNQRPCCSQQEQ